MYVPAAFAESDVEKAFGFIARHSFGVLISVHDGEPFATHLPLLVERGSGADGSRGALVGHMARANPQWAGAEGREVMAVFSGPHAYVSPTWYAAEDVVPTWNYAAVHVYGTFRAADEAETLRIVGEMTRTYEAEMAVPWRFDAASPFNRRMIKAVVGFRIEITRVEQKYKMSQNQSAERRERVVRALREGGTAAGVEVAEIVAETLRDSA